MSGFKTDLLQRFLLENHFWCLLLLLSRFSRVRLCATQWTAAHQAPPSLGFSRQEHWTGLPFPSPMHESEKGKWSRSVMSDSLRPHGLQPTRLLCPWDFPGKSTGVGCHCLLPPFLLSVSYLYFASQIKFFSIVRPCLIFPVVLVYLMYMYPCHGSHHVHSLSSSNIWKKLLTHSRCSINICWMNKCCLYLLMCVSSLDYKFPCICNNWSARVRSLPLSDWLGYMSYILQSLHISSIQKYKVNSYYNFNNILVHFDRIDFIFPNNQLKQIYINGGKAILMITNENISEFGSWKVLFVLTF